MLGWDAAVTETESPSQLSPAVIQSMCNSRTAGVCWVDLPYGIVSAAMAPPFGYPAPVWARVYDQSMKESVEGYQAGSENVPDQQIRGSCSLNGRSTMR